MWAAEYLWQAVFMLLRNDKFGQASRMSYDTILWSGKTLFFWKRSMYVKNYVVIFFKNTKFIFLILQ